MAGTYACKNDSNVTKCTYLCYILFKQDIGLSLIQVFSFGILVYLIVIVDPTHKNMV